jgi:hypothetical protein
MTLHPSFSPHLKSINIGRLIQTKCILKSRLFCFFEIADELDRLDRIIILHLQQGVSHL